MINVHNEYNTSILGGQEVAKENTDKYGILGIKYIKNRVYKLKAMIKKPKVEEVSSNIAIIGIYIINPDISELLKN